MLKLKKIAITGGLAAGKTTVCQLFRELGAYVVSADEIVHRLLSPRTSIGQRVISLLGLDILSGPEIDRKKVSKIVFPHPEKLRALEQIIHPVVFDEIEKQYRQIQKEGKYQLFIAEIPLFYEAKYESNLEEHFDAIVSVVAEPSICKERFLQEKGHTEGEFQQRMARQIDQRIKAEQAHYVLYNNGTLEELRAQVKALFSNFISC